MFYKPDFNLVMHFGFGPSFYQWSNTKQIILKILLWKSNCRNQTVPVLFFPLSLSPAIFVTTKRASCKNIRLAISVFRVDTLPMAAYLNAKIYFYPLSTFYYTIQRVTLYFIVRQHKHKTNLRVLRRVVSPFSLESKPVTFTTTVLCFSSLNGKRWKRNNFFQWTSPESKTQKKCGIQLWSCNARSPFVPIRHCCPAAS